MTHSEDEEDTGHLFGLPDSAIAIIEVDGISMSPDTIGTWLILRLRTELTDRMPQ